MKNDKKKKSKDELKDELLKGRNQIPTDAPLKKNVEISEEELQARLFLEGMLQFETENLTYKDQIAKKEKQKEKEDAELIKFLNGKEYTLGELKALVALDKQPYRAYFPNDDPFFPEMYRLQGEEWKQLDSKDYNKPPIVGVWINEIIYNRFPGGVLPYLQFKNPILPGGFYRKYKLSQYLNDEGKELLIKFRDEARALMQGCNTWYEFRQKLFEVHGVPYQAKMFK